MVSNTQIRIRPDGKWHRRERGNGGDKTACNEPIGAAFQSRDWELDDDMCEICFTRHERDTGRMNKIVIELERDADPALFHDPDDEPTDPNGDPDGTL